MKDIKKGVMSSAEIAKVKKEKIPFILQSTVIFIILVVVDLLLYVFLSILMDQGNVMFIKNKAVFFWGGLFVSFISILIYYFIKTKPINDDIKSKKKLIHKEVITKKEIVREYAYNATGPSSDIYAESFLLFTPNNQYEVDKKMYTSCDEQQLLLIHKTLKSNILLNIEKGK